MNVHKLLLFPVIAVALSVVGCGSAPRAMNNLQDDPNRMTCHYDGDNFRVEYFSSDYSGSADDGFNAAAVDCGVNTSVLYDGDDIIVFDGNRRIFYSEFADDSFLKAVVAAGTNVAGGYDGDTFIVYDGLSNRFNSEFADDDVSVAKIGAGEDVVILYDGDNMIAYDARRHRFSSEFAADGESYAVVAGGRGGALAYDGDNLFAYCSYQGRWTSEFAEDRQVARANVNQETGQAQVLIGSKLFQLDPLSCDIDSL